VRRILIRVEDIDSCLDLPVDGSCRVAVFPNPSPAAGFWKKRFYGERETAEKVVEIVQNACSMGKL